MASEAVITKRLIISGLTPAITADDISKRLSSFGTVKATDGFGLVDGVGQPRKFGYVTIETTASKVGKCMNLLSGSTWRGAKLRFGEAKPDFKERIEKEHEKIAAAGPPEKKRRISSRAAVHGEDMSLVTPENVAERPGWHVSELGRITHPIRVRPDHPLPAVEVDPKVKLSSRKKRHRAPDTRVRRKTIDVTKFGSTQLKGIFLDSVVFAPSSTKQASPPPVDDFNSSESEESDSNSKVQRQPSPQPPTSFSPPPKKKQEADQAIANPNPSLSPKTMPVVSQPSTSAVNDIREEATHSLSLLSSLFAGKDDWGGYESVGSDIDEEALQKGDKMLVDEGEPGFEVVPVGQAKAQPMALLSDDEESSDDEEPQPAVKEVVQPAPPTKPAAPSLKTLFAPQPEEAGFSLLGHLDLDLELDDEVPFAINANAPSLGEEETTGPAAATTITVQNQSSQSRIVLDPKTPLFFPFDSTGHNATKARPKDIFDVMKEDHWSWRDPAVAFYRTQTEEEIRKRWEERKGDLTKDWKKRAREATKASRRRGRGDDGL